MKTTIFKLQVIFIVLAFSVAGCKKEEPIDGVAFSELDKAPKHLVSKEELPDFLKNLNFEFPFITIYKGEWKNDIVYYVPNIISSCSYCHFYYKDGKRIFDGHDDSIIDFYNTSKNWVIIYTNWK